MGTPGSEHGRPSDAKLGTASARDAAAGGADLRVTRSLTIPAAELEWRFSRSGGPGGQHVNTSATRVELRWNVLASSAPSPGQRGLILERLAGRLDADGTLRIVAAHSRSQHDNRRAAAERLLALLVEALAPRKRRRATQPSGASKRRRLEAKRKQSEKKQRRGKIDW